MNDAIVPTPDDVANLLSEAVAEQTENEYVEKFLTNLQIQLESDPRLYRSFGPYWWPIKRMFINRYIDSFGDNVEAFTVDKFFIADEPNTLAASWAYQNYMIETGNVYTPNHFIPQFDDDDYSYQIVDLSMEDLIAEVKAK